MNSYLALRTHIFCIACMDAGKGREQGCGSFTYMDVGKGREQGCGSFDWILFRGNSDRFISIKRP